VPILRGEMVRVLEEKNYTDGASKARQTLLDEKTIVKEAWYSSEVDLSDPSVQERYDQQQNKFNYVNGQQHGSQEYWYPSRVDPLDPWQTTNSA